MPAETLARSVRQEIKTPATWTKGTLERLRQLLDRQDSDKTAAHHTSSNQKPNPPKSKTSVHPRRAKAGAAKFTVLEVEEVQHVRLPSSAQLRLATDVFNTALKTLSEASKTPLRDNTPKGRPVTGDSPSRQALNITSPNHIDRTALEAKVARSLPENLTHRKVPIHVVAQCAQTALRSLLRLQKDKKESGLSTHFQLIQAASALVTKLTTLEMAEVAWEELYLLRQLLSDATGVQRSIGEQGQNETSSKSEPYNVSSMLNFSSLPSHGPILKLVISFQLLVVRVVAQQPKAEIVKHLINAVDPLQDNTPARIILDSLERGLLTVDFAGQQLPMLSQALFATCRILTASETFKHSHGAKYIFELQSIALQIRLSWWAITRHQFDLQKEIWGPLLKYLSTFHRSCWQCSKNDIVACVKAVRNLEMSLRTCNERASSVDTPTSISNLLARMAEDAGLFAEAIAIYEAILTQSDANKGLFSATQLCKITALQLQNKNDYSPKLLIESLSSVRSSLTGPMKGTASELDELHCGVVGLQKAISKATMRLGLNEADDASVPCTDKQLLVCCSRISFDILFFQLRYIGECPFEDNEGSVRERFLARLENVIKSARSTLENVLNACRRSVEFGDPLWEESELAIDNTLALGEKLQTSERWQQNAHNYFVRLSNIYWTRYVKLKAEGAPLKMLVVPLRKSVDILTARPISERQAGKITEKLERLAIALVESSKINEALQTYTTAIGVFAELGVIDSLVKEATQHSYQDLWPLELYPTLQRLLCGLVQAAMRTKEAPSVPMFNLETFSEAARCLLVERQIHFITSLKVSEIHAPTLVWMLQDFLNSFKASSYPVRRLRVLHQLFSFASKEPNLLPDDFLLSVSTEITKMDLEESTLGHDTGLGRFRAYLMTSTQLLWTFTCSRPSLEHCQHAVRSWEALLESCQSWTDVKSRIEDVHGFYCLLENLYNFAEMQDYSDLSVDTLQVMARYLEWQPRKDHSALSSCLSQLALQLTRAGFSKKAGHIFARAKHHLEKAESRTMISLQWNLAYAEYLIDISNLETSSGVLVSAQWLYDTDFPYQLEGSNIRHSRLAQDKFLCQAAYVNSRLAVEQQDAYTALQSAKQCVKLTSRIWVGLEKMMGTNHARVCSEVHDGEGSEIEVDSLSGGLNGLSLSATSHSVSRSSAIGPAFWPYVSLHFLGLLQMSVVLAQNRMFQDSIYYCEQAKRVADVTGAVHRQVAIEALLSRYWAMAGNRKESEVLYQACQTKAKALDPSLSIVRAQMRLAQVGLTDTLPSSIFCNHGELRSPKQLLPSVSKILQQLTAPSSRCFMTATAPKETTSRRQLGKRSVAETKLVTAKRLGKSTRPSCQRPNKPAHMKSFESATPDVPDSFPIARCEQDLKFLNARFLMKDGEMEEAGSVFQQQTVSLVSLESRLFTSILIANTFLARAKAALAEDAVYCVLSESSVALPSVVREKGQSLSFLIESLERDPSITKSKNASRKTRCANDPEGTQALLQEARTHLIKARRSKSCLVDLHAFSALCSAWSEMIILSSILNFSVESGPTTSLSLSCFDRVRQTSREKSTISLDKYFEDRARLMDWPTDQVHEDRLEDVDDESSLPDTILGTLPCDWDVISVQLSSNDTELVLSKLRQGQTPFTLRLPLRRASADGTDTGEGFDFKTCRDEMLSIIDQANSTAHDSHTWKGKKGKREWWAKREDLDERLRVLLENIENIWFGGFRGIFSPHARRPDLLARFSQSFQQILDNNLPSRRKPNTIEQECPGLHPHILDLFICLGDPIKMDLDDSVTDLLYFVVDILQFHGERNAYDEIDFDLIAVQTIDALRAYHETCNSLAGDTRHTILILDKSLHLFPWESLPCLQEQSISRLPSLLSLQDRLSMTNSKDDSPTSVQIDRGLGSYILNPSSDLKGTEETFASHFSTYLPNFTSIIDRAPTESEFKSCLTGSALCLYFGHGSGAQFIRGRTIRRLEKCAVTFLMGCSSSKLVDCGEFEPYGVPWNYMHAGAPALVGTLWDVTDKDIDRFAMKTFENWGLFPKIDTSETKPPQRPGRSRGRATQQAKIGTGLMKSKEMSDVMCLDEAVAKGRDACVLRYLNGAAPVVYGIPVSLAD